MKKLFSIIMFLAVVMTACDLPFGPQNGVIFKVRLYSSNNQKGETKLLEVSPAKSFVSVGGAADTWDTTWVATEFKNTYEFRLYFEVDSNDDLYKYCLIDAVQIQVYTSAGATGWLSPQQWDYYFDNWEGSNDAISIDNTYAIVVNAHPTEQEFHDFGFAIPDGAAILGIAVRVKGYCVKEL